jgi:biopolymer transport protein ExbB
VIDFIYLLLRTVTGWVGLDHGFVNMWESIRDFIELGGSVLILIGMLLVVMWIMILERIMYFATRHRKIVIDTVNAWNARHERKSWQAHRIREAMISEVHLKATRSLNLIQACVALCPLLGLLGTVTGMVEVFEVMAVMGTGNARAMAAGVSKATVPTMSGRVGALSGLFFSVWLQRKADAEIEALGEHMTMDH